MPLHPNVKARFLNAMFKGDVLTLPTTWYLALYTTNLSTSTLPTTVNELPRSLGYARIKGADAGGISTNAWSSATSAVGVKNSTGLQFPDPTGSWSMNAFAIHDSTSTGAGGSTIWFFANLNSTVSVTAGNPVRFTSASLTIFLE